MLALTPSSNTVTCHNQPADARALFYPLQSIILNYPPKRLGIRIVLGQRPALLALLAGYVDPF